MTQQLKFSELLREAVTQPGVVSGAYSLFHSYSIGNAIATWSQLRAREIEPGPIASFHRWKELGRHVRRGERGIVLCMPITCKRANGEAGPDGEADAVTFTRFVWRANWFALAQTEGADVSAPLAVPGWDADTALAALGIERIVFDMVDGNCQGFARKRSVAVSPLAENPVKTLVHELAHVVLGHTGDGDLSDAGELRKCDVEVEAEGCAYIVCSVLGVASLEKSRGYIQHWLGSSDVSERSASRIFKAADTILKAGRC